MMDKVPAESMELWREESVTQLLVREIHVLRARWSASALNDAANGAPDVNVRAAAGRVAGFDEVLRLIAEKGTPDE